MCAVDAGVAMCRAHTKLHHIGLVAWITILALTPIRRDLSRWTHFTHASFDWRRTCLASNALFPTQGYPPSRSVEHLRVPTRDATICEHTACLLIDVWLLRCWARFAGSRLSRIPSSTGLASSTVGIGLAPVVTLRTFAIDASSTAGARYTRRSLIVGLLSVLALIAESTCSRMRDSARLARCFVFYWLFPRDTCLADTKYRGVAIIGARNTFSMVLVWTRSGFAGSARCPFLVCDTRLLTKLACTERAVAARYTTNTASAVPIRTGTGCARQTSCVFLVYHVW